MLEAGQGLTAVSTADLIKALRGLFRGDLPCPIAIEGLACVGLQHCAGELLRTLRTLEEPAVRAVLVAVIAERRRTHRVTADGRSFNVANAPDNDDTYRAQLPPPPP